MRNASTFTKLFLSPSISATIAKRQNSSAHLSFGRFVRFSEKRTGERYGVWYDLRTIPGGAAVVGVVVMMVMVIGSYRRWLGGLR